MAAEDWKIDRFDGTMIRVKNGQNYLTLQAQPGGAYEFEEIDSADSYKLIWDGDVTRLTITLHLDANIQMEFSQRNNGFPIALFNGISEELFNDFKRHADEHQANDAAAQQPANRPPAAPAAGGRKSRKMSKKYCKKTTCRKMGFTQKASCRPYKNCY